MTPIILIIVGLAGLIVASEVVVNAAKAIAASLGVSPLIVGLTITSIGTSLPEIATNVSVALNSAGGTGDASGIATGNIVGSCLSQITLLLGITALFGALPVSRRALMRDGSMMLVAIGGMLLVSLDGVISQLEGVLLISAYVAYLAVVWRTRQLGAATDDVQDDTARPITLWWELVKISAGLAVVVFSADVIIVNGVAIARAAHISESAIGLGVGLATSLPELAVSLRSVRAGAPGVALGNLIGSNVTDPLASLGAGAALYPVTVPAGVVSFDIPAWSIATVLALVFLMTARGIGRPQAVVLIASFGAYLGLRASLVGL